MDLQTWAIDLQHSQVQFKVKHLAIANVSGAFRKFGGAVATTSTHGFDNSEIYFELNTASIDTNNPERDNHLKSGMFLNADKYPKISFDGKLIKADDEYKLNGNLTILETTLPVSMAVEYTGMGKGRYNDIRAGFEVHGKINRKDFGLNFNLLNEAGDLVVGNDIKLHCDIELIKKDA